MKRINKLVVTSLHKIFKAFDEQITCDIRKLVRLRNLKEIIDEHQSKFMSRIKISNVIQMQIVYDYLTNFK